jgi:outer membrane receptor protein involved in Fe transport
VTGRPEGSSRDEGASSGSRSAEPAPAKSGRKSFWNRFRLAQATGPSPSTQAEQGGDGGATTSAQDSRDSSPQLEEIVVTGTNLRTGEAQSAANLRIATAIEIEESGTSSIAGFLKKIPEIGAEGFGENRVNTSSPGTADVSLRGLGANSTLVLLNGRRVTPAPFAQGGSAAALGTIQFVDLNMIPVDAVERVEVLKDGASAIYGADAVAGVVNLILKDEAEGVTLRAYSGNFPGSVGASTVKASVYGGGSSGGFKFFALGNYMQQDESRYGELKPKRIALSNGSNPGTFIVPVGGRNPITGAIIPAGTAASARTFTVDGSSTGNPVVFNTTPATAAQNRYDINAELTPQPRATRTGIARRCSSRRLCPRPRSSSWPVAKHPTVHGLAAKQRPSLRCRRAAKTAMVCVVRRIDETFVAVAFEDVVAVLERDRVLEHELPVGDTRRFDPIDPGERQRV